MPIPPANAPSRPTVLINARLVDPASNRDEPGGVLVKDGLITDLGPHLRRNAPDGADVIDCKGHVLCPGLIDMQVFTGEPGYEHRETLRTAGEAAAAGGVTTMVVMPDTNPVIDEVALVDFIRRRGRDNCVVNVLIAAALTKGLDGKEMAEIGLLRRTGAVAFTNGKHSVADTRVMRNALLYSRDFDALIMHYTEDPYLSANSAMNSGTTAARLGLPATSKIAEVIMLERDVRLVEITGGRYHASTISCAESLAVVRAAKARGLPVTCGVSINHLIFNETDIGSYRTFFKVRPALRAEEDRAAMVRALAAGDIDVVVSSHDPQDADVKRRPFAEAEHGAIGLETLLAAALRLHHTERIALNVLLRPMTINPAKLLGLPSGRLEKGAPADLTVFDLTAYWVVDRALLKSRSKNSPFDEGTLNGRVIRTMVAGRTVYQYG
ncbi:MAG: dihydroorotase [Hyphomicrobiaceae bacterium]